MSVLPSIGPTRRRTFTMNVIVFMGLGALALAYLIFVGARPDLVAAWRDKPDEAQTAIVETKRTVERALADLDPIKQGVGEMKMDVENMKTGMQEAMERDRILLTKVETLERATAQASRQGRRRARCTQESGPRASGSQARRRSRAGEDHRDGEHRAAEGRGAGQARTGRRAARHRPVARTRCASPGRSSTIATAHR